MKVTITAPIYVTHPDHQRYLDLTTQSIQSKEHDLTFRPVENFIAPDFRPLAYKFMDNQKIDLFSISLPEDSPQSVALAWNLGIEAADFDHQDYCLVINTDIVLKPNAIDRLVAKFETMPEAIMLTMAEWSDLDSLGDCPEDENISEHPHFSCFMVRPKQFVKTMRYFDENFQPAYCEDGDMHARIALSNQHAYIYGGARFYHFGSRTIKSDNREWQKNTQTFPRNQQYFLRKWGHPPVNEVDQMRQVYFAHPFNNADMDINDWVAPE